MILSAAEQQLVRIIRAAASHGPCAGTNYSVRITTTAAAPYRPRAPQPRQVSQAIAPHLALAALDGVTRHVMGGFSDPALRSLPPERD
jgi:hypothetical protein